MEQKKAMFKLGFACTAKWNRVCKQVPKLQRVKVFYDKLDYYQINTVQCKANRNSFGDCYWENPVLWEFCKHKLYLLV